MSDASGENLPAIVTDSISISGIPRESFELILAGASDALEHQAIMTGKVKLGGDPLYIADPPYEEVVTGTLRSAQEHEITYLTQSDRGNKFIGSVKPDTVIASGTAKLRSRIKELQQLEAQKSQLAADHPLGAGGLVLANEFGGIDPETPELTGRLLVAKALVAHNANLTTIDDVIRAGLLNPLLGELIGKDYAEYLRNTFTLFGSLALLPETLRESAGSDLVEGAVVRSREFVEAKAGSIVMAAHAAKDPELAQEVLVAIEENDGRAGRLYSSSSQVYEEI